jgi:hypothetical protein
MRMMWLKTVRERMHGPSRKTKNAVNNDRLFTMSGCSVVDARLGVWHQPQRIRYHRWWSFFDFLSCSFNVFFQDVDIVWFGNPMALVGKGIYPHFYFH